METCELICHPDHPALAVERIEARIVSASEDWLTLRWRIEGSGALMVPSFAGKGLADGLWRATCFELFLRVPGGDAYTEINLSPSERWAAYDFNGYRKGMRDRDKPRNADCTFRGGSRFAIFDAAVPIAGLPPLPWSYGLSAVIEETGGHKSYWALAHPPGKPDFHHPTCFAATLPAPQTL